MFYSWPWQTHQASQINQTSWTMTKTWWRLAGSHPRAMEETPSLDTSSRRNQDLATGRRYEVYRSQISVRHFSTKNISKRRDCQLFKNYLQPEGFLILQVGEVPADLDHVIIPELEEGKEYEFRVTPVNDAGPGEPSDPTANVLTKCRRCMSHNSYLNALFLPQTYTITVKQTLLFSAPKDPEGHVPSLYPGEGGTKLHHRCAVHWRTPTRGYLGSWWKGVHFYHNFKKALWYFIKHKQLNTNTYLPICVDIWLSFFQLIMKFFSYNI